MEPVVVAVLIGIAVYMGVVALIPKNILAESNPYTQGVLEQLERENMNIPTRQDTGSILREHIQRSNFVTRAFFTLPGAKAVYPKMLKAGMANNIESFFGMLLIVFLLLVYALKSFKFWGALMALAITYLIARWMIKRRIRKRNDAFLESFPDALDMIVRSVRSGYPLNAAVKMVADNMQPPVSTEFKQVADETAYGSTLIDALARLCFRIDEPDVRFFVVMLTVQQDVGGNLAEVLSNLAGIIRKRRHLRLKIKAMTSEGRSTAWVLGALPLVVAGAIKYVSPHHFDPLFNTALGNMLLLGAFGIYLLGAFIVRAMVNMEV